jgi:hypothetical protein
MRNAWLSLYDVERCYGGPEEGGWWYDHWTHHMSIPLISNRRESEKWFTRKNPWRYQVKGKGRFYWLHGARRVREGRPAQYQTLGRPYYE